MTRTQLYLPESQYEELRKLAQAGGRTFASLVREFLEERLRAVKKATESSKKKVLFYAMKKSLKKMEQLKEEGITRNGSADHDNFLYSHENFLRH